MSRVRAVIAREIREALPATIFFLFLFHMVALTKAVSLEEYDITALRATGATVGALIVAKAILLVDALPIASLFSGTLIFQMLWRTLLYGSVTLLFRLVEEFIPLALHHGGLNAAVAALYEEVSWPLFGPIGVAGQAVPTSC